MNGLTLMTTSVHVPMRNLVLCHSQNLACVKGFRSQLCGAPVGPFRQLTPEPFTAPIPKLDCDNALVQIPALTLAVSRGVVDEVSERNTPADASAVFSHGLFRGMTPTLE
jgi:hypothetical protein